MMLLTGQLGSILTLGGWNFCNCNLKIKCNFELKSAFLCTKLLFLNRREQKPSIVHVLY